MYQTRSFWTPMIALALAAASLASCVTVKQQTYLQPLPESSTPVKAGEMPQMPDYRLQTYDIIQIQVKTNNPEIDALYNKQVAQNQGNMMQGPAPIYFTGYHILPSGHVNIPGVGEVYIAGKTVTEAQDAIFQAMSPLFGNKDAYQIHVSLSGIRFTVMGECARPGVHYLYLDRGTIMDALAYAGDMTFLADRRRVQVLRQTNETWQRFELDLTSAEVLQNPHFYLQPNDIITVRPLPQKSWGFGQTGFASFTSLLSVLSTTLTLYIALNR